MTTNRSWSRRLTVVDGAIVLVVAIGGSVTAPPPSSPPEQAAPPTTAATAASAHQAVRGALTADNLRTRLRTDVGAHVVRATT